MPDNVNVIEKISEIAKIPLAALPALSGEVCGKCTAFDPETGMCTERHFLTKPDTPACAYYDEVR